MRVQPAILAGGLLLLSGCASQLGYYARQGSYLLRYSFGARSAQAMIADPATPADTRAFLIRVTEIKEFAAGSIGLKDNKNYTRYRAVSSDHIVDVVSACDAVSFTPYLWRYPVLGRLPYKGFFQRADADREAARLSAAGYDVTVRPVDAFSTLGFTRDPLYSFMQEYSPFELASLIIHEQTHATLFVKGQPDFNEALATLVGIEGALEWVRQYYGGRSTEYAAALKANADADAFSSLLRGLAGELDAVYRGASSREEKLARKAEIIDAFKARFALERAVTINNALLSQYRLYNDDIPLLRSYWQRVCGGDLRGLVKAAGAMAKRGDVKSLMLQALERLP